MFRKAAVKDRDQENNEWMTKSRIMSIPPRSRVVNGNFENRGLFVGKVQRLINK